MYQRACPSRITAGDTLTRVYACDDYPSNAGWVLSLYLSAGAETPLVILATADVDAVSYDFALTAAVSKALTPGKMHFRARAVSADGTQIVTIAYGEFLVLADPTQAVDKRSQNEINLIAVRAGIAARLAGTLMDEYTISGVSVKMPALSRLLEIEARLLARINREKGKNVLKSIPVRLNKAGGGIPFGTRRTW